MNTTKRISDRFTRRYTWKLEDVSNMYGTPERTEKKTKEHNIDKCAMCKRKEAEYGR